MSSRIPEHLRSFIAQEDDGATAIEYALIAAFLTIALISVLPPVGDAIENLFEGLGETLEGVPAPED